MWSTVKQLIARYNAHKARVNFRRQRYGLCLHYLEHLRYWDERYLEQPTFAGYLALCHYQLKHWDNLTEEVERALFLLRRHTKTSTEALILWQELKSHLVDLRYIDQRPTALKKIHNI